MSDTKQTIITVQAYEKKFKTIAIGPIDFQVTKGTIHALVGQSGSGKSVLLRSIIGAIVPTSYQGAIHINGFKVSSAKAKTKMGFALNLEKFPQGITAVKFLKHLGKTVNISTSQLDQNMETLLRKFKLWEHRNKRLNSFSSGMKNRIMIIVALLNDPDLIILDEPGANLDSESRLFLFDLLKQLKAQGKTILLTSHLIDEIKDIIDDFTLIENGKLLYAGSKNYLQIGTHYLLNTNDNQAASAILTANNISWKPEEDHLLVTLPDEQAKQTFNRLLKASNLFIKNYHQKEVDLLFLKTLISQIAKPEIINDEEKAPPELAIHQTLKTGIKGIKTKVFRRLGSTDMANTQVNPTATEQIAITEQLIKTTEELIKATKAMPMPEPIIPSPAATTIKPATENFLWTTDHIELAWNKGLIIPGFNPKLYRKDYAGALIFRHSFIDHPTIDSETNIKSYNWTINLQKPINYGGIVDPTNIMPLHTLNALSKNNDFPKWKTTITFNRSENTIKEQEWKVDQ